MGAVSACIFEQKEFTLGLRILNTKTHLKEDFVPLREGEVRMYVCGPTVYDLLHVGNFRGAIFFNLVRNWLEHKGFKVTYIYNYTDVDDKIIDRAKKEGVSASEISEKYIQEFKQDYASLKLRPHSRNPRVTEFMPEIIDFVTELIKKGMGYVENGDVYFDVHLFKQYGQLSNKNLEDLESGHRVGVDERKRHSADFALWKSAKPGEPSWESPWGAGRPGWHIECSAMIRSLLGDTIDIHGGGLDLVFPHHENEVAQSEGCTGKTFVRYWMHNNMINFGDQKMSKSLGNVRTGRSFLEQYDPEILKFMMISSHYRSTVDLNTDQIHRAISGLARIYSAMAHAEAAIKANLELVPLNEKFEGAIEEADKGIEEALDDDFNTPEAMARIFEIVRLYNNLNRAPGKMTPQKKAIAEVFFHWLKNKGDVLALFQESPAGYLLFLDNMLLTQMGLERGMVDGLVKERDRARSEKNWAESDRIRNELTAKGIALQDTPEGTLWEVAK